MNDGIFILAGGNDRNSIGYGRHLSDEIAKYITNPKILSCFFSFPKETWEEKSSVWKGWFLDNFTQPFTFDYARSESFLSQIDTADVIYFHGGDTKLLLATLPDTQLLKDHLKGKIIVGSSAGANMFAKYFWSSTRGVLGEGRGLLNVNTMVHYGAPDASGYKRTPKDWEREEAEFKKHIGNEALFRIPEGRFVTILTVQAFYNLLKRDLTTAMKARQIDAVAALRSVIAAIDNAQSVDNSVVSGARANHSVVTAGSGVGSTEVQRQQLSLDDIRKIVQVEITDLTTEAERYMMLGQAEPADRLRRQADVLTTYLHEYLRTDLK